MIKILPINFTTKQIQPTSFIRKIITNKKIAKTLEKDTVDFNHTKPPENWMIHTDDLIRPEELKNLKFWDDYVLLAHYSTKAPIIRKEGLKCFTDINPKLAGYRKKHGFCNDPDLIYFMPITPNGYRNIYKDDIVIAVPKDSARVFNQNGRAYGNFKLYCNTSMPVEQYDYLLSELKPSQYLKGNKIAGQYESESFDYDRGELNEYYSYEEERFGDDFGCRYEEYMPEVCFADKYISPEYFVQL